MARREMLANHTCAWIKLPQPNVQIPERLKICKGGRAGIWGKHQKSPVRKEPVPGSLHQAFAPVADFSFNCGDAQAFKGHRREIVAVPGRFPSHKEHIGPAKAIERKFPTTGQTSLGQLSEFGIHVSPFKFGHEIGLSTFAGARIREVPPGVLTPELDGFWAILRVDHGRVEGRGYGVRIPDLSGLSSQIALPAQSPYPPVAQKWTLASDIPRLGILPTAQTEPP